jgi:hypothetical protein
VAVVTVLAAIGAVVFGGIWAMQRFPSDAQEPETDQETAVTTATVVRVDLIDEETLEGTLRFANQGSVAAQAPGTITSLPEIGSVLRRGHIAFEVDGLPVFLMYGERPAWRPIGNTPEDEPDTTQVVTNLEALGFRLQYPYGEEFEELPAFTTRASDLIRQWQEDEGLEETGVIELGRVLFLPGPVRVADLAVEVGSPITVGTPVLLTSDRDQEVQVWLDADRQDLLDVGDAVGLELPDESLTSGVVSDISRVVTTIGTATETRRVFEVSIQLDDPEAAAEFDEAPVDVLIAKVKAAGVLAVPVKALLALAEGGYAVEIQVTVGVTRLVGVDIGSFADGLVEVTGDLNEGDVVLVPG